MKAAIFTIDTGKYKAKAESAAATALKRMLVQVGFEVKAAGVLPQEKEVLASVIRQLADSRSVDLSSRQDPWDIGRETVHRMR